MIHDGENRPEGCQSPENLATPTPVLPGPIGDRSEPAHQEGDPDHARHGSELHERQIPVLGEARRTPGAHRVGMDVHEFEGRRRQRIDERAREAWEPRAHEPVGEIGQTPQESVEDGEERHQRQRHPAPNQIAPNPMRNARM